MSQLVLPGNATPADVREGKKFSAGQYYNAAGTMQTAGTYARAATQVLVNKSDDFIYQLDVPFEVPGWNMSNTSVIIITLNTQLQTASGSMLGFSPWNSCTYYNVGGGWYCTRTSLMSPRGEELILSSTDISMDGTRFHPVLRIWAKDPWPFPIDNFDADIIIYR
ncbi:hypothetical protein [Paenibacillus tyrfis]|uniref:Uncharacterized protein n=1 Tax=Paenibacillus tyrfis TaxID=1501230 RepID=A0A081NV42_9BACL|nr:hypothetical protein [Paenibacillus tyrfis]KEQ22315.1 hypothetical protein ET33_26460 [Paenibacillus tyrfis]